MCCNGDEILFVYVGTALSTTDEDLFYECGSNGYVCWDPDASENANQYWTEDCEALFPDWLGDGLCDQDYNGYNTLACGWDGGDCCERTCVDDAYTCATLEYYCLDPEAREYDTFNCDVETTSRVGDGYCDHLADGYNTHICNWDGGDCCEDSCVDGSSECGVIGYFCLDPDELVSPACPGNQTAYWGDGYCDMHHQALELHLVTQTHAFLVSHIYIQVFLCLIQFYFH